MLDRQILTGVAAVRPGLEQYIKGGGELVLKKLDLSKSNSTQSRSIRIMKFILSIALFALAVVTAAAPTRTLPSA
jgi:hypothetical protein